MPHINGSILGDIVTYLVFTLAGAEMWQRAFAKSKKAATQGMFWGTSIYMVTIALVFFMGLAGRQILPDVVASYGSSDAVVPALAVSILPPGLTGLALAGILSVMMSTADSYLLVSVQTFVHDLGKNFMPEMTEKHEILMSRVMSVVLAMGALIIALRLKTPTMSSCLPGPSTWRRQACPPGGPVLEKATSQGIISAMTGGFVVCVGWKLAGNPWGLGETVPGALVCGILLVAVSLATCKSIRAEWRNPAFLHKLFNDTVEVQHAYSQQYIHDFGHFLNLARSQLQHHVNRQGHTDSIGNIVGEYGKGNTDKRREGFCKIIIIDVSHGT